MYGVRLQMLRKRLKLSQEELSTQTGISYRAYTSYERGDRKPALEFLESLMKKFNVNLNFLIGGVGEMFNETAQQNEQLEKIVAQIVDKKMKERGL